jgi:hypothetical protein
LSERFGYIEEEISDRADFDIPILEEGVPFSCRCTIHIFRHNNILVRGRRHRLPNLFCKKEAVNNINELQYHRTRRVGNGI